MKDNYQLPSEGGLIPGADPEDMISRWEKIRTRVAATETEGAEYIASEIAAEINRRRAEGKKYVMALSSGKSPLGVYNRLYAGLTGPGDGLQMPLYGLYGGRVYKGDPMYASARRYNYTRVYWSPQIGQGVTLNLEIGLHSDLRNMGFHQIAQVGVRLDSDFFRKKR